MLYKKSGVKFQIGSQQRSSEQFRYGAELSSLTDV
jgi:hypothetical protein